MTDANNIYERLSSPARHPRDISVDGEGAELVRSFSFIDLSGFTQYCAENGPAQAQIVLRSFRKLVRRICSQRGVRVSKWLGDGVMLVGSDPVSVVACCLDIVSRVQSDKLEIRGGVSTGPALLLDGDDYTGRAVNLASRLCDASPSKSIYIDQDSAEGIPAWSTQTKCQAFVIKGIGLRSDIIELKLSDYSGLEVWDLGF